MKNEKKKKKEKKRQISTQKWPRKRFLHEILKKYHKISNDKHVVKRVENSFVGTC